MALPESCRWCVPSRLMIGPMPLPTEDHISSLFASEVNTFISVNCTAAKEGAMTATSRYMQKAIEVICKAGHTSSFVSRSSSLGGFSFLPIFVATADELVDDIELIDDRDLLFCCEKIASLLATSPSTCIYLHTDGLSISASLDVIAFLVTRILLGPVDDTAPLTNHHTDPSGLAAPMADQAGRIILAEGGSSIWKTIAHAYALSNGILPTPTASAVSPSSILFDGSLVKGTGGLGPTATTSSPEARVMDDIARALPSLLLNQAPPTSIAVSAAMERRRERMGQKAAPQSNNQTSSHGGGLMLGAVSEMSLPRELSRRGSFKPTDHSTNLISTLSSVERASSFAMDLIRSDTAMSPVSRKGVGPSSPRRGVSIKSLQSILAAGEDDEGEGTAGAAGSGAPIRSYDFGAASDVGDLLVISRTAAKEFSPSHAPEPPASPDALAGRRLTASPRTGRLITARGKTISEGEVVEDSEEKARLLLIKQRSFSDTLK